MRLTYKDKSLILFIFSLTIVLWGIYTFFSFLFYKVTHDSSAVHKIITQEAQKDDKWFNLSRALTKKDLEGKVILLDFWSHACVSCIQSLPKIQEIEKEFGKKILVIGVHSPKFDNAKNDKSIKKAILKYDITHPILNDEDLEIWNNFEVNSYPTYILINPKGRVHKRFVGSKEVDNIKKSVTKLISDYKYEINRESLPIILEKNAIISNVLEFPTKIEYSDSFKYRNKRIPVIFVANTGKNQIIASSLSGRIVAKIGMGKTGFEDGSFYGASFNKPQGILFKNDKLYVADTGNHALRVIDFKKKRVSTIIGNGEIGNLIEDDKIISKETKLASPTDIEFYPDNNVIAIANSATNQILSYNLKTKILSAIAGNGEKNLIDGNYPKNSLAQTIDLIPYKNKLYFLDARSSSLRSLDKDGNVKTLIGREIDDFGFANGTKSSALMQNPLGLTADSKGIYISDSFNHSLRMYDFNSKKLTHIAGNKRGKKLIDAYKVQFDEPEGILTVKNKFYIADSNNNRIVVIDRKTKEAKILNIIPPLKFSNEGFLEYLPNLGRQKETVVKAKSEIKMVLELEKNYKINEKAPSFVNLLKMNGKDKANLIASYDWHAIKNAKFKLPKLDSGKKYLVQGSIYFCEDKKNALCYIKSYENYILAKRSSKIAKIIVKIGR